MLRVNLDLVTSSGSNPMCNKRNSVLYITRIVSTENPSYCCRIY